MCSFIQTSFFTYSTIILSLDEKMEPFVANVFTRSSIHPVRSLFAEFKRIEEAKPHISSVWKIGRQSWTAASIPSNVLVHVSRSSILSGAKLRSIAFPFRPHIELKINV